MTVNEIGWLPLCEPEKGEPWFAGCVPVGYTQKETREAFTKHCTGRPGYERKCWDDLRKEGWRIVRVRITTELHQ
jgi:hypothetical protein